MAKIETQQRHFIVDMEEREVAALVRSLEKENQVTSPSYDLRKDLIKALGYTPDNNA
jgi:hypothetical protein